MLVIEDERLFVMSDEAAYVDTAVAVISGDDPDLSSVEGVADLVDAAGEPIDAELWAGDFACEDLAMSTADEDTQDEADALVAKAGKISPLTGLVMAMGADRSLTVSELFEDDGTAKANLRPRATLAVGDAVGRGGSFSDDFSLTSSRTDGARVLLKLEPKQESGYVLSALDSGPVVFATC